MAFHFKIFLIIAIVGKCVVARRDAFEAKSNLEVNISNEKVAKNQAKVSVNERVDENSTFILPPRFGTHSGGSSEQGNRRRVR